MKTRSRALIGKSSRQLMKWRWLILLLIGGSLLWVEVQEFLVLRVLNQAFHYFEVFQYAVLLISTGTLIELFSRSNREYKQAIHILNFKHQLSMEFAEIEDWDALTAKLVELPDRIADVEEAYLLETNSITDKLEIARHWQEDQSPLPPVQWDPLIPCSACFETNAAGKVAFHQCKNGVNETAAFHAYSLVIVDGHSKITVLKFRLGPGESLLPEEKKIFSNIGDELSSALRTSRDRKRVAEWQSAQSAMAERRIVSAYVHDQLGQNLGLLHLNLDRLCTMTNPPINRELQSELEQLLRIVDESYEIVRDILEKMRSESVPHLSNVLQEYARKVSQRSGFQLSFKSMGEPVLLAPEIQQAILYTFYEVLANIEKHSGADRVDVQVTWKENSLDISVADNGAGFDSPPAADSKHFGLGIMQERISEIQGTLVINSCEESGTSVSLSIPINKPERVSIK